MYPRTARVRPCLYRDQAFCRAASAACARDAPDLAVSGIRATAAEARPYPAHAAAVIRVYGPYASADGLEAPAVTRTMAVPVRDDLDLTRVAQRRVLALERLEQTLLEESVRALCRALLIELHADIQRFARLRIRVRLRV
jgi:hypothetical protein